MQATEKDGSNMRCYHCRNIDHRMADYTICKTDQPGIQKAALAVFSSRRRQVLCAYISVYQEAPTQRG